MRCGTVRDVKPRERRCKAMHNGPGGYACWGLLVRVVANVASPRASQQTAAPAVPQKPQAKAAAEAQRCERYVAATQTRLDQCIKRLAQLSRQQRAWQRRANLAHQRAQLSDEQVAERRAAAQARLAASREKRHRRGVALKGGGL
jgi:ATPase subunit of ABC transporter with duplicated ATPase domains